MSEEREVIYSATDKKRAQIDEELKNVADKASTTATLIESLYQRRRELTDRIKEAGERIERLKMSLAGGQDMEEDLRLEIQRELGEHEARFNTFLKESGVVLENINQSDATIAELRERTQKASQRLEELARLDRHWDSLLAKIDKSEPKN